MKALIDGDIFCYSHGSATNDEGHPLSWPLVASRINQQIENIVRQSGAENYKIYLTGTNNFREKISTIRVYKGNRPSDKPFHYERVRKHLINFRRAEVINGMEADDKLSIEQMKNYREYEEVHEAIYEGEAGKWTTQEYDCTTIICSLDKDLDNTPGWHYNWSKDNVYWITENGALVHFYNQLLTGDSVDNIPGLYGVGKSSVHLRNVSSCNLELDMYISVKEQYEKRFGSYWWKFFLENAQLLWMLREEPKPKKEYLVHFKETVELLKPEYEIEVRLMCLEEQRRKSLEAN